MSDSQTTMPSNTPLHTNPNARQTLINIAWDTTRRALIMVARTWGNVADTYKLRDSSIVSEMAQAAANVIERRLK